MECGVLVHVKNGKVVGLEGDPNYPVNKGMMCPKGLSAIQLEYHPDRLTYPRKRVGERGSGKWKKISWDEALDTVASEFKRISEKYGPESLAFTFGMCPRGGVVGYHALINALGSPNFSCTDAHYCYSPSVLAQCATFGPTHTFMQDIGADYENTNCILVWGANPVAAEPPMGKQLLQAKTRGAKLIVVDPRLTSRAAKADLWLQIRPGTDDALAMAFLNIIINEELYDRDFVNKWCLGFDELRERVQPYTPEAVAETTWIPAALIRKAAKMYATIKPSALKHRVAVDQNFNGVQTMRAFSILIAMTGNTDVKGGNIFQQLPEGFLSGEALRLGPGARPPKEIESRRLGAQEYPLLCGPSAFRPYPHPPTLIRAMLTGEPYPIKGVFLVNNLVVAFQGTSQVIEALKNTEFLVGADFFMTPTMELMDIVLPPATWLERDEICELHCLNWIGARQKVVEPVGECWDEMKIALELARRMDVKLPMVPVYSVEEYNDAKVKGMGITFDDLKQRGWIPAPMKYKKYESAGKFGTPSGKVELYSTLFEKFGHDPLPSVIEPPQSPYSTPELTEEYPLIITAGRRHIAYYHSMGRQIPWLRELAPEPLIEIHPETARRFDIEEGDRVWIETPGGKGKRVRQRARLTRQVHPQVVQPEAHWWLPEKPGPGHGIEEININAVISNDPPYGPVVGTVPIRSLLCKIYKAEEV
jgi:anaerobic selenocysteine-containing dehydrogenase